MKVLITRDASQAGGLQEKLEAIGAEVVSVPTIEIGDPDDWTPFDQALAELESFHWMLFTSANAVRQTAKRFREKNIQMETDTSPKIAVVGNQTARTVESVGWTVRIVPQKFQAEGLLEELLKQDMKGKRIWFPRALKAREFLVPELQAAGAEVVLTPVYQNIVPLHNKRRLIETLKGKDIDWITFTSSSTATNFFRILGKVPAQVCLPKLASIGALTTATLEENDLKPAFTANPQNLDGLASGIKNWKG